MSSPFIQLIPQVTLTTDPLINAIFGGLVMELVSAMVSTKGISSGGTDVISLTIRKMTGRSVGSISSGQWDYHAFCRPSFWLAIRPLFDGDHLCFQSSDDALFTRQKKMRP